MKLNTFSTTGQNLTVNGNDLIFAAKVNVGLLAQVLRVYKMNQRQGTAKTQTRSEVNRTTKKWFKQKGTGNARHGARSAPIFVGGGQAHGPNGLQNWSRKTTKNLKHQALIAALSAQIQNVVVCSDLEKLDGKTASGSRLIKAICPKAKKVLVLINNQEPLIDRSLKNIPSVLLFSSEKVTAWEISAADAIIMTASSLQSLEQRLLEPKISKTKSADSAAAPVKKTEVAPVKTKLVAKAKSVAKAKPVVSAKPAKAKKVTVKKVATKKVAK